MTPPRCPPILCRKARLHSDTSEWDMADPGAGWVLDSLVSLIDSPPWKCLVDNFIDENCLGTTVSQC